MLLPLSSSCGDEATKQACGADLAAKVDSLVDAADAMSASATAVRNDALAACSAIVTDLGGTLPMQGEMTDDEHLTQVCAAAETAIDAELTGSVTIEIAVEPPRCTIDAQAQFQCEASCSVDGSCDPGTVEARCEPGELSVKCDGTCEVDAWCEAEANATVTCEGTCHGVCMGTCMGSSNDAGECAGTCTGDCQGSCEITADAGVDCGANARCKGGCDGTATLPECHAELTPPSCDIDAECKSGCESQASFNAECTDGRVVVVITGDVNANLKSTLETNLPALLTIATGLEGLVGDTVEFTAALTAVIDEVGASTEACVAAAGARMAAAAEAVTSAVGSISVSVEVSVEVSASASASGGA